MRALARKVKLTARRLLGQEISVRPTLKLATDSIGNHGARWTFDPKGLGADSVVYSFGIGEDISFDLGIIAAYGVTVFAFDPTPRSQKWLESQSLPSQFKFYPWGLADHDGTASFLPPVDPSHVSYTILDRPETVNQAVEAPVLRLATIAERLGHSKIDLLKVDIEGAEYSVIEDIVQSKVPVRQFLVEFHHRWPQIGLEKTKTALETLRRHGYELFDVADTGEEYGFIKHH
jgi:FkbM family methyltransferase